MDTPSAPYVAFLESDAAGDTWVADHDDPDLITWSGFTEGTEAIVFTKIKSRRITAIPGNVAEVVSGGNTFEYRTGKRFYRFQYVFQLSSRSEVNMVTKFPMLEAHTEKTSWKYYYLIDVNGTDDHIAFVDEDGSPKSYAPVHIQQMIENWDSGNNLIHNIMVQGVTVW